MAWLINYAAIGISVAGFALVIVAERRSDAVLLALFAGLLWPVLALGAVQLGLVVALANVARRGVRPTAPPPEPAIV